ncbi:MAG TPA: DUF1801 domain-containing protein [Gemmataceae bacterium]|nr:DUF1801 domain-containing protein [Gemmataceae bacterium]
MVKSKARTVAEYLDELPEVRRGVVAAVREMILRHLPSGYRETLNWGMICYEVPLERYPDTYNGQPLAYLALAAQKNHFALYLTCVYQCPEEEAWMRAEFSKAGKKLDKGKSCLRFRRLEDLPLEVIGQLVAKVTPEDYIARYEASRQK